MFGRQVEEKKLNPHFCLNTNLPVKHFIIWIFKPHLYIWLNVNPSSVLCYCIAKLNKMENVLLSFVVFFFACVLNCIGLWLHLQELCYFELIWLSNSIVRSFPPKQQCECVWRAFNCTAAFVCVVYQAHCYVNLLLSVVVMWMSIFGWSKDPPFTHVRPPSHRPPCWIPEVKLH